MRSWECIYEAGLGSGFAALLAEGLCLSDHLLEDLRLRRVEAEPQSIKLNGKPEAFRKDSGLAATHSVHRPVHSSRRPRLLRSNMVLRGLVRSWWLRHDKLKLIGHINRSLLHALSMSANLSTQTRKRLPEVNQFPKHIVPLGLAR